MEKLALLGGTPICEKRGEYMKWPVASEKERAALLRVLESGRWGSSGGENARLAERFSAYCGTKYALATLNGSMSLEMILRALQIGRGDEVIVSPYTFAATAQAVALAGAYPVFADTDPETHTIDPDSIGERITPKTRAILAVHLGGRPFDIDRVREIADRRGLYLIEDCAHAHGSEWRGKKVGSFGVAGAFSCQASKNISAGEGGLITTDDPALYEKMRSVCNDGRAFPGDGYDSPFLGTDARLAQWQCAVLLAQMERLDGDTDRRMANASWLEDRFDELGFVGALRRDARVTRNSHHVFSFRYFSERIDGLPRSVFLRALNAENVLIGGEGYSEPVYDMAFLHNESFRKQTGRTFVNPKDGLPGNERIARREGMWLYHSTLLGEREDMEKIIEAMRRVCAQRGELIRAFGRGEGAV